MSIPCFVKLFQKWWDDIRDVLLYFICSNTVCSINVSLKAMLWSSKLINFTVVEAVNDFLKVYLTLAMGINRK